MTVDRSRLPNLVVIGAQKCGTTSLHYYLSAHPQISMSSDKELDFFIEELNWRRGLEWYASHFNPAAAVRGESSPNYTALHLFPGVAGRMQRVIPDARLIFVVRDPVDRLVSHWVHSYAKGNESRLMHEVLEDDRYLSRSRYAMQLRPFLDAFPRERILILEMDDLKHHRHETMRAVYEFLGVDPTFRSLLFWRELHRSSAKRRKTALGLRISNSRVGAWVDSLPARWRSDVQKLLYWPFSRPIDRPVLSPDDRRRLADRLAPDVEEFRAMTGRSFSRWTL
ncbi:MAG TPA: sulfotransferase [Vicinamibacterales bacterium]|nr:sulfotransferase [Vicinamibacterales bacterium]